MTIMLFFVLRPSSLAQSEALLLSLKIKVAANSLRSFAFDKVTRQRVLEQSYQLAWEVRLSKGLFVCILRVCLCVYVSLCLCVYRV